MGKLEKAIRLLKSLEICQNNVSFSDLCMLAEMAGLTFDRQKGSHKIYRHAKHPGIMNFQDVNDKAKPYQVKQLLVLLASMA